MREEVKANRKLWDELTPIHLRSELYDLGGFKVGRCSLLPLEVEEVGDVAGRSLLHLQCHFGMDTLSWARRGAKVTGMDFSAVAVAEARALAAELGIDARFLECDLYELPDRLDERFDIVYSSAGVLCWLPDLAKWARIAASFVKPGGMFFIREFHPVSFMLDDDEPFIRYSYFNGPEPLRFENAGSYADPNDKKVRVSYEWPHSLSEVLTSITDAGLQIEKFHEYDYTMHKAHDFLRRCEDGLWRYDGVPGSLPLMYMVRAKRPL